ncbi:MAG: hypothetical protein QNJ70_22220 [Xenococcaceae cyanobacterium MO_207.B15]|nr:hypothetical protein [Xenococcaceae cyanobacterium MO_207.B15]
MPPKEFNEKNLPIIIRRLNHVKVDCYPDARLKAKMYYGLIYLYRDK